MAPLVQQSDARCYFTALSGVLGVVARGKASEKSWLP